MNAVVEHRGKKRNARGFSIAEVVEAGLDWKDLPRLKVRIDKKRSSVYKENVKSLKELASNIPPRKKKPKKKKAERAANRVKPKK